MGLLILWFEYCIQYVYSYSIAYSDCVTLDVGTIYTVYTVAVTIKKRRRRKTSHILSFPCLCSLLKPIQQLGTKRGNKLDSISTFILQQICLIFWHNKSDIIQTDRQTIDHNNKYKRNKFIILEMVDSLDLSFSQFHLIMIRLIRLSDSVIWYTFGPICTVQWMTVALKRHTCTQHQQIIINIIVIFIATITEKRRQWWWW